MENHTRIALENMNPCGVESQPKTFCNYREECSRKKKGSSRFLCISDQAYQIAQCLMVSDIETQKNGLRRLVESGISFPGVIIADPKEEKWFRYLIKGMEDGVVDKIINRAQEMYDSASSI